MALAAVSAVLVGGAVAYGNSLSRPPGGPVVPAGVSAAALARYHLTLEAAPISPLCGVHDWTVEHRVPLSLGSCPITRAEAVREATVQPKAPVCPPGVMCLQLRATAEGPGPAAAMLIAPHTDSVVDARLVTATSPTIPALSGGRVAWAVSVNRVYQAGGPARTGPPSPYLTLVDASSGAIVLSIVGR